MFRGSFSYYLRFSHYHGVWPCDRDKLHVGRYAFSAYGFDLFDCLDHEVDLNSQEQTLVEYSSVVEPR